MESTRAITQLSALSHEGRLSVFRLLVRHLPGEMRPSDIASALGLKPNTLSVYLSALEGGGLVSARRAGRAIHYRALIGAVDGLVGFLTQDCCRGRSAICATPRLSQPMEDAMTDRKYSVLFLCTGNSARSIFAEALLRDIGGDRFDVHSAGIAPASAPNPFALEVLERNGLSTEGLRSKSVDSYQGEGAPIFDFVFTVCDRAANEECPPWPGQPLTAHWGLPDPVKAEGTDAEIALAFAQTFGAMRRRVLAFSALPLGTLDRLSLQDRLDGIDAAAVAEADRDAAATT